MAVALAGFAVNLADEGTVSSKSVTMTANPGDVLVAMIKLSESGRSINVPAGWETHFLGDHSTTPGAHFLGVFSRVVGPAGLVNPAFTLDGQSDEWGVGVMRFSGADSVDPLTDVVVDNTLITAGPTCPAANVAIANSLVLRLFGSNLDPPATPDSNYPSGLTGIFLRQLLGAENIQSIGVAYGMQAATGATGTAQFVGALNGISRVIALTLVIRPAAIGPVSGSGGATDTIDTASGTGNLPISGSAAITEAPDVAAATGNVATVAAALADWATNSQDLNVSSRTVTIACEAGDFLIAFSKINQSARTLNNPTDWTLLWDLVQSGATNSKLKVWYRALTSALSSQAFTIAGGTSDEWDCGVFRFTGVDLEDPIYDSDETHAASILTSPVCPPSTITGPALVFRLFTAEGIVNAPEDTRYPLELVGVFLRQMVGAENSQTIGAAYGKQAGTGTTAEALFPQAVITASRAMAVTIALRPAALATNTASLTLAALAQRQDLLASSSLSAAGRATFAGSATLTAAAQAAKVLGVSLNAASRATRITSALLAALGQTGRTAEVSTDAVALLARQVTANLTAAAQATQDALAAVDAAAQISPTMASMIDGVARALIQLQASLDSVALAHLQATSTLTAAGLTGLTLQAALDATGQAPDENVLQSTLEAAAQATRSRQAAIDATAQVSGALASTMNAVAKANLQLAVALDAVAQPAGLLAVTAALEAASQVARTAAATLAAAGQGSLTAEAALDAVTRAAAALSTSLDGTARIMFSLASSMDAAASAALAAQADLDARAVLVRTTAATLDSAARTRLSAVAMLDAVTDTILPTGLDGPFRVTGRTGTTRARAASSGVTVATDG